VFIHCPDIKNKDNGDKMFLVEKKKSGGYKINISLK
jgi:hypothetical protein